MLNANLSFLKTLHVVIDDDTSTKAQVYKCILFSSLFPIPTYFCILRFSHEVLSAGLVLSMIAGMMTISFLQIISKLLRKMLYWQFAGAVTPHKHPDTCCYTKIIGKPFCVLKYFLAFLLHSRLIIPVVQPFSITLSFLISCTSIFWAAYIISFSIFTSFFPSFSMPVFLLNKTSHLLFHNYTSLISFP